MLFFGDDHVAKDAQPPDLGLHHVPRLQQAALRSVAKDTHSGWSKPIDRSPETAEPAAKQVLLTALVQRAGKSSGDQRDVLVLLGEG